MAIQDLSASLDLKQNLNIYATCKQNDSLNLILSIYDNSVAVDISAYRVRLRAMKFDKVPLIQERIGISANGNVVNIEAHEQLTTTAGNTPIELQFVDKATGKRKATFNLVLVVVASAISIDASISKATYTLLEELENKIDQCSDFFENIDTAINLDNELKSTISIANTAKSNLDSSISAGNISKEDLDETISTGDTLKTGLETNIETGNTLKTNLESATNTGNALLESLENFEEQHADVSDISNKLAIVNASLSEIVNIEQFKTNGDNDYNNAFIRAIEHGGNIILHGKDYNLSQTLVLKNNTKFIGNGLTRLVFSVPNGEPAIITDESVMDSIQGFENLAIVPKDWSSHSGSGIIATRQISMKNVSVVGFKKTNLFIHHDIRQIGSYMSLFINCNFNYSGEHGVVLGNGANNIRFISCRTYWNGSQEFLKPPSVVGNYDGVLVTTRTTDGNVSGGRYYGYSLNNFPTYVPEGIELGIDSSYNSRYGFNLSGVARSTINIDYAEENLATDLFVGVDSLDSFIFANKIDPSKMIREATYYNSVSIFSKGNIMSGGNLSSIIPIKEDLQSVYTLLKSADNSSMLNLVGDFTNKSLLFSWQNINKILFNYFFELRNTGFTLKTDGWDSYLDARKIIQADGIPASGSWNKNDIVLNTNIVAGGNIGWVCVVSGTPGVWKSFGTINI